MVLSSQSMQEVGEWGGGGRGQGREEGHGAEGRWGGESVLAWHPTVCVFMMEDVLEAQREVFGLC